MKPITPMPIVTPIIINQGRREVNCIIESGVRYCEAKDNYRKELGVALLGSTVIIIYLISLCAIGVFFDKEYIIPIGIFAPIILGGLYLFFF